MVEMDPFIPQPFSLMATETNQDRLGIMAESVRGGREGRGQGGKEVPLLAKPKEGMRSILLC